MEKSISVGHVVESLEAQYKNYNPMNYLQSVKKTCCKEDAAVIDSLELVDRNLHEQLKDLYRNLLFYNKGTVNQIIKSILSFLNSEYKETIRGLSLGVSNTTYNVFSGWKLFWMLNYIYDAEYLSDEDYSSKYGFMHNDSELISKLRSFYFEPSELKEMCTSRM